MLISAAQVNADEKLKDSSESSDESTEDKASNILQKGWDLNSYDPMFAIMPWFNPTNNWNKGTNVNQAVDIFHLSQEWRKKDVKDYFDWINFKTPGVDK